MACTNACNHNFIDESIQCKLHTAHSVIHYDLNKVRDLYNTWNTCLPQIKPFYAVKCNPDKQLLHTLHTLGMCFDCASLHEINTCLELNIPPSNIIFANPCKFTQDITYALQHGITLMTFDSICELDKIARICTELDITNVQLVLRIYANDPDARCNLSDKYGAEIDEWTSLLMHAKSLHLQIIGISFHIGSGAANPEIFKEAILSSRKLYNDAQTHGFKIRILDIGGGFTSSNFKNMAASINDALIMHFPPELECAFIAEPGRYFAETIATYYTKIIGKRVRKSGRFDYIVADSLYGLFNCKIYDHVTLDPPLIIYSTKNSTSICNRSIYHNTRILGCTCDSNEILFTDIYLPEMNLDDWLKIPNFGAYTICAASSFNGIDFKNIKHVYT